MNRRHKKWIILAVAGSVSGLAMLLLGRSIPLTAGTATGVVLAIIVLKHVALALIVGSPLAALLRTIKPQVHMKIRAHCPFANS